MFTGGISTYGNTAGTTGTVGKGVLFVGGTNITLSQSITDGNVTISIIGGAGGEGGGSFSAGVSNIGNTAGNTGTVSNQIVFAGGNNVTLSQSTAAGGATVTISGPNTVAQSVVPGIQSISAGTTRATTGQVIFSNSNGVSFGLDGATVTATVKTDYQTSGAYLTTAALSNHSHGNPTLNLTNLSGTTASNSAGFTLSLSAGAGGPGGGGFTGSRWWPFNEAQNVSGQQGQATLHLCPAQLDDAELHMDRICFPVVYSNATNSTGSVTISMWMALYTRTAASISLMHSMSTTQGFTHSGTVRNSLMSGVRLMSMPWSTTFTQGEYIVGVMSRSTTGGGNATINQLLVSQFTNATQGAYSGILGAASATSAQWPLGFGIYATSTLTLPNSIAFSQIRGTGTLDARPPSWYARLSTF